MNIYFFLVVLLAIFAFLDYFHNSIANQIMFYILVFILIFISGFRYGLETDYWSYWKIFHGTSKQNVEIGYEFFSKIIQLFTNNFNYFVFFVAIISIGLKCKIFVKFKYPFIILLIFFLRFFLFFELNAIRQGLATAFLLTATYYLSRKKKYAAFFFMCLATSMHISSAVFIVAFFLKDYNWTVKKIIISITMFIIFRFFLLIPLINAFSFLAGIGGTFIVKGTKYLLQSRVPPMTGMAISVIRIMIPVMCIYNLGIDNNNRIYFNLFIIGAFINIAFIGMSTISYRLAMVFYATEGIAVSESIKQRNLKTAMLIGIIIILNLVSFYIGITSSQTALPYRNYLFIDPNSLRV